MIIDLRSENMDEVKKLSSPARNSHSGDREEPSIEARFIQFCKNELSLDDKFLVQATKLFNEIKHILSTSISSVGSGMPEEVERYWFAFVLYSVKRLSDEREADNSNGGSGENGFTLCQILRAAKLNIVDFFKELPQFIVKVGVILRNLYGADWEKRLEAKELQANFVHLSLLSK
ncbi:Retinoblastoma-related protein 1 [Abeliophyllum distichum]|uniref:Retinoblastoma-related protein 1 n=1 Tax=Abeliophyllum distichum TaxID=126358 RepID=A0ABD1TL83_9LAMI